MLDNTLIKNALALTGKTPWDMQVLAPFDKSTSSIIEEFSIEKFCYYLLSPEFIEKYAKVTEDVPDETGHTMNTYRKIYSGTQIERIEIEFKAVYYTEIGKAIYEYQSGNEKPLIELLSKIK